MNAETIRGRHVKTVTRLRRPDPTAIAQAVRLVRKGRLVAVPTETVYGLCADATSDAAVAGIYAAKARPAFNPLIVHVAGLEAARREGLFSEVALALAQAFWPGPLTLVVPVASSSTVCELARAGLTSVALRVPAHPVAQAFIAALDRPVAAPSANRSGGVSPTTAAHVLADLGGRIDMILDGGATPVGIESTIVSCLDGTIAVLRPGGVPRQALAQVLGRGIVSSGDASCASAPWQSGRAAARHATIVAPGMLASHYAPRATLRLNAEAIGPGEAALDFGGRFIAAPAPRRDLSPIGDLLEAAANLFAHLRALDATGAAVIAVAPIPATGLGEAINDRLARAAAPRG